MEFINSNPSHQTGTYARSLITVVPLALCGMFATRETAMFASASAWCAPSSTYERELRVARDIDVKTSGEFLIS